MTGAYDLDLADPASAGAYFVTGGELDRLDAEARGTDGLVLRADLRGCHGKGDLLRRLAATFDLPDRFGCNWDALSDCLRDLGWLQAPGYVLLLDHAVELRSAAEADFDMLVDILEETASAWRERDIAFFSFLELPESAFEQEAG